MFRIFAAVMLFFITLTHPLFAFITVPIALIVIATIILRSCARNDALVEIDTIEKERERRKILKALS